MTFLMNRLQSLAELIKQTVVTEAGHSISFEEAQKKVLSILRNSIEFEKKVFVVGNGGSAGIASHHVVDLVNVVKAAAMTLSDSNLLTCFGNDYGYDTVYSRPLETLASKGDILIAISSSGSSQNILNACEVMQDKEGYVITLSGFDKANPLRQLGHLNIWTGQQDYGLVETAHFFILHTFIDAWAHTGKTIKKEVLEIVS